MGDFNIDFKNNGAEFDKLSEMCDSFILKNLIKSETCYTKNHKSLIDLFFTNKPLSFQETHVTETGLSDYHKLNVFQTPYFSNRGFQKLEQRL